MLILAKAPRPRILCRRLEHAVRRVARAGAGVVVRAECRGQSIAIPADAVIVTSSLGVFRRWLVL